MCVRHLWDPKWRNSWKHVKITSLRKCAPCWHQVTEGLRGCCLPLRACEAVVYPWPCSAPCGLPSIGLPSIGLPSIGLGGTAKWSLASWHEALTCKWCPGTKRHAKWSSVSWHLARSVTPCMCMHSRCGTNMSAVVSGTINVNVVVGPHQRSKLSPAGQVSWHQG